MVADAEDVPPITASPIPNCHWLLQFLTAEIYPSSLIQTFLSWIDFSVDLHGQRLELRIVPERVILWAVLAVPGTERVGRIEQGPDDRPDRQVEMPACRVGCASRLRRGPIP